MLRALRGLFLLMSTSNYHCKYTLKVLDLIGVVATTFILITYIAPEVLAGELDPSSQVITVPPSQWTVFLSGLDQYYAALGIPNIFLSNYVIPVPNVTSGPITGMHLQMDSFGLPVLSGSGLSFTLPGITRTNSPGYYMSFAFSSQDNIPATAYSITFTASPWQNLFCTMSDGFTSQVVAINSETTTFTSSKVIGRDAAFGCDNAYGNGTPVYVNINSVSVIRYGFDLSVSKPKISQLGSTIGADGITTVSPGNPVTVLVPVSSSNVPSGDSRSAIVKLETANQTFQQTVPLNAIQIAGTLDVPFSVTFGPQNVGLQTITATVDPGNALGESDPSNNIKSVQVKVAPAYHLIVSTQNADSSWQDISNAGGIVSAVPSDLVAVTSNPIPFAIRCEDASGNPAPQGSCKFRLALTPGTDKGGHMHNDGTPRTLVLEGKESLLLMQPDATSFTVPLLVDTYGANLTYIPPEIAGDIVLTVTGSDAQSGATLGNPIPVTFHNAILGLNEILENSFVFRLTGATADHPKNHFLSDDGFRVTFLADDFVERFKTTLGLNDMSLPLGGKFDIGAINRPQPEPYWLGKYNNTFTHHWYHRDGHSVDIDRCAPPQGDNPEVVLEPCPYSQYPSNWVKVPKRTIEQLCKMYKGKIIIETPIHCEFSKE